MYIVNNQCKLQQHILYRLEQEKGTESQEATRNLVLMLASLSTCGFKEIRPSQASQGSLFQMGGFILPQPSGQGLCFSFYMLSVHAFKQRY